MQNGLIKIVNDMTKEELRGKFNEVIEQAEERGYLTISDAMDLTHSGIPITEMCRDKEVFNAIRNRFEKWLNSF